MKFPCYTCEKLVLLIVFLVYLLCSLNFKNIVVKLYLQIIQSH